MTPQEGQQWRDLAIGLRHALDTEQARVLRVFGAGVVTGSAITALIAWLF